MSAMALAGDRPLGHAFVQFMIVWQRYSRNGSSRSSRRCPVASSLLLSLNLRLAMEAVVAALKMLIVVAAGAAGEAPTPSPVE